MSSRTRGFWIAIAIALVVAAWAGPAGAASVEGSADAIRFTAAVGEKNQVSIYKLGGDLVVEDAVSAVTPFGNCVADANAPSDPDSAHVALCPAPFGTENQPNVTIDTGDKKDWIYPQTYGPVTVLAGDGNDKVFAYDNRGPVRIEGGAGSDTLTGSGHELFSGLAYSDTIVPGDGADKVAWLLPSGWGLTGTDTVDLSEVKIKTDRVQCEGGDDTIVNASAKDRFIDC